ncbi:MAG: 3-dehydroquinate synthase family protein [Bacteriovorax sp.]|nr:3-dehydroquinate synthase family protein [Bacteriovorax sp.]
MKTKIKNIELESIVEEINNLDTDTVLLVVDHLVWSHYSKDLILEKIENKKVIFWKSPDGEKVKNINDFQNAVEFFLEKGIHRNAHLVAIGGGAVSDFAGFVAATILRGIQWSIVPTTLLAMVDASIGGKVAINSKSGKNLIGAFHMPTNVWICSKFIASLPETEKNSGMGEVLKYCFLDYSIYDLAIKKAPIEQIIDACAQFKQNLTQEDFKETGIRRILNLGHSFGHALEFIYNLPHGESVMWGMVLIFKVFGSEKNINDIIALKNVLNIPGKNPPWFNKEFPIDKIMTYLSKDKKISALSSIDLVLVQDIGNAQIERKSFEEIQEALELNKDELRKFTL